MTVAPQATYYISCTLPLRTARVQTRLHYTVMLGYTPFRRTLAVRDCVTDGDQNDYRNIASLDDCT